MSLRSRRRRRRQRGPNLAKTRRAERKWERELEEAILCEIRSGRMRWPWHLALVAESLPEDSRGPELRALLSAEKKIRAARHVGAGCAPRLVTALCMGTR